MWSNYNEKEHTKYFNKFVYSLLNFKSYYLLTLNIIIYKKNKSIYNLIFINKIYYI